MDEYTEKVWQDIDLRVDTATLCTSCHISAINKQDRSKTLLKANTYFKRVLMDIIPDTSFKSFTKETTFDNYLFIVEAY